MRSTLRGDTIMRKKLVVLFLTLLILVGLASGYVAGGLHTYALYQQSSLASQEHCGSQFPVHICVKTPLDVFSAYHPSYVLSHTTLFTIIYSSNNPLTLLVSVSIQGFSEVETHTVSASPGLQRTSFIPPLLNDQVLRSLTANNNTSVRMNTASMPGNW